MATQTAHPQRANARLWLLALSGAALLGLLPLALFDGEEGGSSPPAAIDTGAARIAYLEFGRDADTIWLASPANPKARRQLGTIPHAPDFGAVAALAPRGDRLAYTMLDPTIKPSPDAPAGLWLTSLTPGSRAAQLAAGVDLLVRPLWSRDGNALVYRRSAGGGAFSLYLYDLQSGSERLLVESGSALFPVSFAPDGNAIYHATIGTDASELHRVDLDSGEGTLVARLAETLTRDWVLSPAGDRLAFLEMSFDDGLVSSRALVLDIASGSISAASPVDANAFGPVWDADGALTIGHDASPERSSALLIRRGTSKSLPAPSSGFDVPLGWAGDVLTVRRFDGPSAADPGRASLEVVSTNGGRTTIATGEVSFLGWITP